MHEIIRWVFFGFGVVLFMAGFFVVRFRIRLAAQQQAQNEKMALFKSGFLGPGRATPRQQLILGVFFIVFGPAFAVLSFFADWSRFG